MAIEIQGTADAAFEGLRTLMQEQVASGEELGASIVINVAGKNVVDLWGGYADEGRTQPWTKDTITHIWSSTKTVAALATLILVDRGLLDLEAPVSKYWPEFGAEGKKDVVLVKHVLSHTSGVSGWEKPMTIQDLYDWDKATSRLAAQKPWWTPGSGSGYHSLNYGHLLGELVRRVTGKSLRDFVREEMAGPLGADLQIGAAEKDWPRISPVVPPPPSGFDLSKMDPESIMAKTFGTPLVDAAYSWTPEWRRAEIPAVNGHSHARGLARILSSITLGGSVDGVKLLSPETIERIFEVQADGVDHVLSIPMRYGIGFGLAGGASAQSVGWLPSGKVCFWGGWGGSLIVMDLDRQITFSYVMNKMGMGILGSTRTEAYIKVAYKALGVEGY
ncbi:beta-lactamase [Capronia coronata CBS 617.96]|uniref:Beta-lactamase n=1 Tax=Capronia coronata CBS 617.96 TaxID=1182541 RepID=W9Y740_9EURO|nr:beta-lactamase [Capronia coronata CBS 617.96]EXJ85430.1 beta-lactamase [Capronia coronata CBS 617.96]